MSSRQVVTLLRVGMFNTKAHVSHRVAAEMRLNNGHGIAVLFAVSAVLFVKDNAKEKRRNLLTQEG